MYVIGGYSCVWAMKKGGCGKGKEEGEGEEKKILRNIIAIMKKNCVALRYRDLLSLVYLT